MSRLDRYLWTELLGPFAAGIGFFLVLTVGIDVLGDLIKLLVRQHFPVGTVLLVFIYSMPRAIAYVLPMATMYAGLSAMGRLSTDSEMAAMKAAGAGFARIARSVVLLGLAVTLVGFVVNELVVPRSNAKATSLVANQARRVAAPRYFLYPVPSPESGEPLRVLVTAKEYDPVTHVLKNVSLTYFQDGLPTHFFEAPRAVWQGDTLEAELQFKKYLPNDNYRVVRTTPKIKLGVPAVLADLRHSRPEDMTLRQLSESIQAIKACVGKTSGNLADYVTQLNLRIAAPFSALAFALVAAPLGLRPHRSSSGINLGISLIVIFFYYIAVHVTQTMARSGTANPFLATWLPNLLLFALGGYLFWDANR